MKIKLLNDGGYSFMYGVKLPAIVDASYTEESSLTGVEVEYSEIARIGATDRMWRKKKGTLYFSEDEFEVIHES